MRFFITSLIFFKMLIYDITALSVPSGTPKRQRRQRSSQSRHSDTKDVSSGPRSNAMRSQQRSRRPGREKEVFDAQKITSQQKPNENANALDIYDTSNLDDPSFIRRRSPSSVVQVSSNDANVLLSDDDISDRTAEIDIKQCKGPEITHEHVEYFSLDDLFPGFDFGKKFFTNGEFRQAIRVAMRKDIFFTTPAYADLSSKVAAMMLDDDSSLQGTWNCVPKNLPIEMKGSVPLRMTRLTEVLKQYLGPNAPTGDDFMMALGSLCGEDPSAHWIDIIGVKDRKVSHSWHQDTGISYEGQSNLKSSRYTVMVGFPFENEYSGCGVFSHVIKLKNEHLAPDDHNENEPVLFEGSADDEYIFRPEFTLGREVLRYRDVDVVHSAPDAVYRQSVMRFM
mmetsp:Transcript_32808/g.49457  ORF Transcript_32808/g.49457 Transcript_32808/m.49457 type:complete len:394 (+) Transcript_32808:44-1225(+)